MKKLVLGVFFGAMFAMTNANSTDLTIEDCASLSKTATSIMKARQSGVPLVDIIAISKSKLHKQMVVSAYKEPAFSTDKYKNKAVAEFSNSWMLSCVNLVMK